MGAGGKKGQLKVMDKQTLGDSAELPIYIRNSSYSKGWDGGKGTVMGGVECYLPEISVWWL